MLLTNDESRNEINEAEIEIKRVLHVTCGMCMCDVTLIEDSEEESKKVHFI